MITLEQLKDAEERTAALKRYLDIDSKRIEVEEEELRTHVADFWDDRDKAEAQMRKIKELHFWIDSYTANSLTGIKFFDKLISVNRKGDVRMFIFSAK